MSLFEDFFLTCAHEVPPALKKKRPHIRCCAICTIARMTTSIKDIQKQLSDRGGVFISQEGTDWRDRPAEHLDLNHRWHWTKVKALNLVEVLRDILAQAEGCGLAREEKKGLRNLRDALGMWDAEVEAGELWKIPGVKYEGDDEDVGNLGLWINDPVLEELWRSQMRQGRVNAVGRGARQVHSITPARPQSPSSTRATLGESSTATNSSRSIPTPPPDSALSSVINSTLRSILKREGAKMSPTSVPVVQKRACFADSATIFPDAPFNLSNTPHFLIPAPAIHHHRDSEAGNERSNQTFRRRSSAYIPGTWASPSFMQKVDTNHCSEP
jgi:hypothetical protein